MDSGLVGRFNCILAFGVLYELGHLAIVQTGIHIILDICVDVLVWLGHNFPCYLAVLLFDLSPVYETIAR